MSESRNFPTFTKTLSGGDYLAIKGGSRIALSVLGNEPGVLGEMVGTLKDVLERLDVQDQTDEGWSKDDD